MQEKETESSASDKASSAMRTFLLKERAVIDRIKTEVEEFLKKRKLQSGALSAG